MLTTVSKSELKDEDDINERMIEELDGINHDGEDIYSSLCK